MTKEVISLSRIVKERDERLYSEETKFVIKVLFCYFINETIYYLYKEIKI